MERQTLKFAPNIPVLVTIEFDQPRSGVGQHGPWFRYGCKSRGIDCSFFATEILHDKLQKLGRLKGRTIEITKVVDETNKSHWILSENGVEVGRQQPPIPIIQESPLQRDVEMVELRNLVNDLKSRVEALEAFNSLSDDPIGNPYQ